jgi:hypothetical protein
MYSKMELAGKSFGNVQFYSIPNIDGAMDRQSQKEYQKSTKRVLIIIIMGYCYGGELYATPILVRLVV